MIINKNKIKNLVCIVCLLGRLYPMTVKTHEPVKTQEPIGQKNVHTNTKEVYIMSDFLCFATSKFQFKENTKSVIKNMKFLHS